MTFQSQSFSLAASSFSTPLTSGNHCDLLSAWQFFLFRSSYKWHHRVYSLLIRFFYLTWCFGDFIHVIGYTVVPLCCLVVLSRFDRTHLFIHSPIAKYLACFQCLASIKKTAVKICRACKFLCGHIFSYISQQRMGLLGYLRRIRLTW